MQGLDAPHGRPRHAHIASNGNTESHMVSKSGDTPETQNMRRALQVLRVLGSHHEEGVSVSDVVAATQLERSTAHHLLTCMVEEHFADREPGSRRYRLGLEAMRLGLASLSGAPLVGS